MRFPKQLHSENGMTYTTSDHGHSYQLDDSPGNQRVASLALSASRPDPIATAALAAADATIHRHYSDAPNDHGGALALSADTGEDPNAKLTPQSRHVLARLISRTSQPPQYDQFIYAERELRLVYTSPAGVMDRPAFLAALKMYCHATGYKMPPV